MAHRCCVCGTTARYVTYDAHHPDDGPLVAYCPAHLPHEVLRRQPDSLARQLVREQMG